MVDKVAKSVFLAIFDVRLQLFGSAAILAFSFGVFYGGVARFLVLGARDDFIVDAGDDLLDGPPGIGISRFRSGRLSGLFGFRIGGSHRRLFKSGRGRRLRLRTLRMLLRRERQDGAKRHDNN